MSSDVANAESSPAELKVPGSTSQASTSKLPPAYILCLSGGGFRATLFHLGVVYWLRKHNYLRDLLRDNSDHGRIEAVVGVSGGSFVAAQICMLWEYLARSDAEAHARWIDVVSGATASGILAKLLRKPFSFFFRPGVASRDVSEAYAKALWGDPGEMLRELDRRPRSDFRAPAVAIQTTDLTSGCVVSVCVTRKCDESSGEVFEKTLVEFDPKQDFKVASTHSLSGEVEIDLLSKAVTFSSAYPAGFPATEHTFVLNASGAQKEEKRFIFTDGGVLDNSGLVTARRLASDLAGDNRDVTIILSDAAALTRTPSGSQPFWKATSRSFELLMETVASLSSSSGGVQPRMVSVSFATACNEILTQKAFDGRLANGRRRKQAVQGGCMKNSRKSAE